jgi:hypothetical protein
MFDNPHTKYHEKKRIPVADIPNKDTYHLIINGNMKIQYKSIPQNPWMCEICRLLIPEL